MDYISLYNRIEQLLDEISGQDSAAAGTAASAPVIVAIDGPCGSGKSTLGELLRSRYDCNLYHMDDFFLQPHQRTPERLAEPGGNVDYERFLKEVLIPVSEGRLVEYRRFDCKTMSIQSPINYEYKPLVIIEGSYSMRPELREYYDLKVYLDISPELQRERIIRRNPPKAAEMFFARWIPMENRYFEAFDVKGIVDVVIS